MSKIIIVVGVAVLIAISYVVTVGLVWLVQYLTNMAFSTDFHFNVWIVGLLVWVVSFAINILFK